MPILDSCILINVSLGLLVCGPCAAPRFGPNMSSFARARFSPGLDSLWPGLSRFIRIVTYVCHVQHEYMLVRCIKTCMGYYILLCFRIVVCSTLLLTRILQYQDTSLHTHSLGYLLPDVANSVSSVQYIFKSVDQYICIVPVSRNSVAAA